MPMVRGMKKNELREREEPQVVLTEGSPCLYCGRVTPEAECDQCGAALDSLKVLTFTPIVKRPAPPPSD